jgi:hypothetical protein
MNTTKISPSVSQDKHSNYSIKCKRNANTILMLQLLVFCAYNEFFPVLSFLSTKQKHAYICAYVYYSNNSSTYAKFSLRKIWNGMLV